MVNNRAVAGKEMKKGFSLVELMIVVAVLGILAAVVLPAFQGHVAEARSAAAKDILRVLRSTIMLYATEHNGVAPGYASSDTSQTPNYAYYGWQIMWVTNEDGQWAAPGTPGNYPFGPYFSKLPENPFNNNWMPLMIDNTADFPAEATGTNGFIYKPFTKTIRLDWPGTDKSGVRFYDY
ncbi:MAG: type IV pilin protein [Planctomycetota bacterium]|jgi:prepilin-type N-terminal cleavage/methylation domain-containing protein